MVDISPEKVLIVLVIALIVLGPSRLGDAARALGRARTRLRQLTSELPPDAARMIRDPRGALLDVLAEPRQAMVDAAAAARQSVTPTTAPERGDDAE